MSRWGYASHGQPNHAASAATISPPVRLRFTTSGFTINPVESPFSARDARERVRPSERQNVTSPSVASRRLWQRVERATLVLFVPRASPRKEASHSMSELSMLRSTLLASIALTKLKHGGVRQRRPSSFS